MVEIAKQSGHVLAQLQQIRLVVFGLVAEPAEKLVDRLQALPRGRRISQTLPQVLKPLFDGKERARLVWRGAGEIRHVSSRTAA